MELVYKYVEKLKEYIVEENGFHYYMPSSYVALLQEHLKSINIDCECPVEEWYFNLKDLERKVVTRKSKDEEKLSSIW